jgi:hypothetical protein
MKKLLTISAVVFLMVFTAGLATAKTPALTFPYTAVGDLFSISDTGTVGTVVSATLTVDTAEGLYYGTIVTSSFTISYSAVLAAGVYTFTGLITTGTGAGDAVHGAFVITYEKIPGIKKASKEYIAAIQFGNAVTAESYAAPFLIP